MRVIFVIAKNTFREVIRDRLLYVLVLFALLVTGMSLFLGELSFREQSRIAANYGLTGIQLSMVVLSIFIGSTLVRKEIDKKTAFTLLARPVTRFQFLSGKILGFSTSTLFLIIGFSFVLWIILIFLKFPFSVSFVIAFWGILLESILLVCLSVFFSTFSGLMMAPSFTFGCFLIGHWVNDMKFFSEKSESLAFQNFVGVFQYVFPNLENFNWRAAPIYQETVSRSEIFWSSLYLVFWVIILLNLSVLILRKKDLV